MTARKFKRQTPLEAMRKALRLTPAEAKAADAAANAGADTDVTAMERHYHAWLSADRKGFMREFSRLTEARELKESKARARKKEGQVVDPGAEKSIEMIEEWFSKRKLNAG